VELYEKHADQLREIYTNVAQKAILDVWQNNDENDKKSDALGAAQDIIQKFIEVTPPRVESLEAVKTIEIQPIIQIRPGDSVSTKPWNISMNLGDLLDAVSSAVFLTLSVIAAPWAIPFAAVKLCREISLCLEIKLTERDAAVIWAIWKHKDANKSVHVNDIFGKVNEELKMHGRPSMSEQEVKDSLKRLQTIKSIEHPQRDSNRWRIRERVIMEIGV
jgi:hypothetical protein